MNAKEIAEIINVANQCEAKLEGIRMEFLAQIVINTNRIVQILESTIVGGQMELPLQPAQPKAAAPAPKSEEKVAEVAAPVAAKKPAVAKTAPVVAAKPVEVAKPAPKKVEVKGPTKEEVLTALEAFIVNHPDGDDAGVEALGEVLKELGNYTQFPEVPAEKYAELLEKINQE